jgi:uncharacterized protein (TIGR02186 family)
MKLLKYSYLLSCVLLALWMGIVIFIPSSVYALPIMAATSDRHISIDTQFDGRYLWVFGARNDPGDVVVVIRGPKKHYMIRKKERIAGLWIHRKQLYLPDVESFYALASSKPLSNMLHHHLLKRLALNEDAIPLLTPLPEQLTHFAQALWEAKKANQLYIQEPKPFQFIGNILFKVGIALPSHISEGIYTVEIYLMNNEQLSASHITSLYVEKVGFDAWVSHMSYQYPFFYGVVAILIALMMGYVVNSLFNRL